MQPEIQRIFGLLFDSPSCWSHAAKRSESVTVAPSSSNISKESSSHQSSRSWAVNDAEKKSVIFRSWLLQAVLVFAKFSSSSKSSLFSAAAAEELGLFLLGVLNVPSLAFLASELWKLSLLRPALFRTSSFCWSKGQRTSSAVPRKDDEIRRNYRII